MGDGAGFGVPGAVTEYGLLGAVLVEEMGLQDELEGTVGVHSMHPTVAGRVVESLPSITPKTCGPGLSCRVTSKLE